LFLNVLQSLGKCPRAAAPFKPACQAAGQLPSARRAGQQVWLFQDKPSLALVAAARWPPAQPVPFPQQSWAGFVGLQEDWLARKVTLIAIHL